MMKQHVIICLISCLLVAGCKKEQFAITAVTATDSDALATIQSFKVAGVLGSNMVVQRNKPFRVWGSALPGHTITIKASWQNGAITTSVSGDSSWVVTLPPAEANAAPQTLSVKDNNMEAAFFENILIGEVWLCSGQSNMYMPVDSTSSWPGYEGVVSFKQEIAAANYPDIRLIAIQQDYQLNPIPDLYHPARWTVCSPKTVKSYSAVAYFFARQLQSILKVPVGLVVSSVGGTKCETWTGKEAIEADPVLKAYYGGKNRSSRLYNGMIYPLRELSVRGFLWYQGESNREDTPVNNYTRLNTAMIRNWRNVFQQGTLPFYFVQMTPYDQDFITGSLPTDNDYAFFREAQTNILIEPGTGMGVTMDVGQSYRIHPRNKKPVGERLAALALDKTYHLPVKSAGPQYQNFTQNGYHITIHFVQGTADGLETAGKEPIKQHFYIAGADKVFRRALASINGNRIELEVPQETPLPVQSVRYAFTNYPKTNLQNSNGLPMEPFRTDSWQK